MLQGIYFSIFDYVHTLFIKIASGGCWVLLITPVSVVPLVTVRWCHRCPFAMSLVASALLVPIAPSLTGAIGCIRVIGAMGALRAIGALGGISGDGAHFARGAVECPRCP